MLKRLISHCFGMIAPDVEQRIDGASREELQKWGERIV
jgi:hypothetical protein